MEQPANEDADASSSVDMKSEDKFSSKVAGKNLRENNDFISNEIKTSKIGVSDENGKNGEQNVKVIKESKINNKHKEEKARRVSSSKEPKQNSGVKRLGSKLGTKLNHSSELDDGSAVSSELINKEKDNINKSNTVVNQTLPSLLQENSIKQSDDSTGGENLSFEECSVKKEIGEEHSGDGWELEDGFEVPSDFTSKPKDEEFEKELFPVLNKLSSLSTTITGNEGTNKEGTNGGGSGNSWTNWGGWGVSSLLSTATESVSTLTSHVSAGLNTVFETGLGVPDPELLAQALEKEKQDKETEKEKEKLVADKEDVKEIKEEEEEEKEEEAAQISNSASSNYIGLGEGFSQLMSGVSQLGTKVIYEGLDTLETLGKKTMEVLQEGDPGLRKKRALFFQDDDRPVLSQVLREAKENAEKSDKLEEEKQAARKVHFETLFDDYQGLVHLEALEMLSKQCQLKIHTVLLSMSGDALKDLRETLDQVKELCELSDEEDEESDKDDDNDSDSEFSKRVSEAIQMMGVKVPHTKLIEVSEGVSKWLMSESAKNATTSEIHQKAVSSMAEFTSVSMETFHRMAELLLIKQHHSTADEAESLTQLTGALCARVSRMATKYTLLLSENDDNKSNNPIITTIFMESANSSSYIQDACRLLIPVLQVGAST